MKRTTLLLATLSIALATYAQTVENIRVVQDGENLKITYRIGASTDAQLFNVFLSCSMDGGRRFDPEAVIGDVGENIIGGKSFYTIIWDVFADVDEVVNPEFFVRVELVSDMSAPAVPPPATSQAVEQQPAEEKPAPTTTQESPFEPTFEEEKKPLDRFERNGFFTYTGSPYMPIGIGFGSLNNFGYYVNLFRLGIGRDYNEYWDDYDWDVDVITTAGVTKYIIAAGFYRLHAYGGIGGHVSVVDSSTPELFFLFDTGLINVLGPVNLNLGFSYSFGHTYAANLTFGVGFVF